MSKNQYHGQNHLSYDLIEQMSNHYQKEAGWHLSLSNSHAAVMEPTRQGWTGFGECRMLDTGLVLGRSEIKTADAAVESPFSMRCFFGIHIICNADYRLDSKALRQPLNIKAQQIWHRAGEVDDIIATWQADTCNRVVSLDFTAEIFERWAEEFALPHWVNSKHSTLAVFKEASTKQQQRIMQYANLIIDQSTHTLSDKLALESLTLSLCQALFAIPEVKHRQHVDDVIDIIRSEYQRPLTISELAQRSGINECYLKQQFKQRTGKTIANYIRDQRMQEAMRLILNEGKTLQQTAWFVGYKDPASFSKAFKQYYGTSPAQLV